MIGLQQSFETKYGGLYKGYVRDNVDPEGRGRVRVFCPQVMGATDDPNHWLGWAEPSFPWMGGLSTLDFGVPPLSNDNDKESVGVWIMFEQGDPDFPVWIGTFVYAPTVDGVHSKVDESTVTSTAGGSLIAAVAAGTVTGSVAEFNPVSPKKAKEIRLTAKAGIDIVIISDRGGSIVIGPNGVNIQGAFVRANGRTLEADISKIVG